VSRQTGAVRAVRERRHPLDQAAKLVVERLHLAGAHAQDGVRVLADLGERDQPKRFALGVVVVLVGVLMAVLVHVLEVMISLFHNAAQSTRAWPPASSRFQRIEETVARG
jgi:hypothetical protein